MGHIGENHLLRIVKPALRPAPFGDRTCQEFGGITEAGHFPSIGKPKRQQGVGIDDAIHVVNGTRYYPFAGTGERRIVFFF